MDSKKEKALKISDEKELNKILKEIEKEINNHAKNLVEEYAKSPSEMSGSIITIHQNSPLLDEKDD